MKLAAVINVGHAPQTLKQAIAFSANVAAAVLFLFSGKVVWPVAVVMAVGALIGGNLGGRLAGRRSRSDRTSGGNDRRPSDEHRRLDLRSGDYHR